VIARFGPSLLDVPRRELSRDGTSLHLTPKAFDLVSLLVGEAPRVVAKAELHERLWPGTFVSDATLAGLVKELRRALDDHDPERPIIRTVHRVGYAFSPALDERPPRSEGEWHWLLAGNRRIPLHAGENLVGRDPASHVWLDAASVSRAHARIWVGQEDVVLEDLGSKNGTTVGESRVSGPVALHDGDRIHVGSVLAVYRSSRSGMSTETQADPAVQVGNRDVPSRK
jgi:DNA-binding winged helix-turn-helix (wHTH) protein